MLVGEEGPESVPLELAETGELIPLSLDLLPIDPIDSLLEMSRPGNMSNDMRKSRIASSCTVIEFARGRGAGPQTTGTGGWKAGRGSEGSVCLGCLREGIGPVTRRSGVGGGRRGMLYCKD